MNGGGASGRGVIAVIAERLFAWRMICGRLSDGRKL